MNKKRSAYFNENTFDIYTIKHGSGYEGIHVQVNEYTSPIADDTKILITRDAISPDEFDLHINELIEHLNELRSKGYKELKKIARRSNSN